MNVNHKSLRKLLCIWMHFHPLVSHKGRMGAVMRAVGGDVGEGARVVGGEESHATEFCLLESWI